MSWRSRFRRHKASDKASDTADDPVAATKSLRSRFLRRSKSEVSDETHSFETKESSLLDQDDNKSTEPISVQDILDRNRNLLANSRSPRSWRKLIQSDRATSPSTRSRPKTPESGATSTRSRPKTPESFVNKNESSSRSRFHSKSPVSREERTDSGYCSTSQDQSAANTNSYVSGRLRRSSKRNIDDDSNIAEVSAILDRKTLSGEETSRKSNRTYSPYDNTSHVSDTSNQSSRRGSDRTYNTETADYTGSRRARRRSTYSVLEEGTDSTFEKAEDKNDVSSSREIRRRQRRHESADTNSISVVGSGTVSQTSHTSGSSSAGSKGSGVLRKPRAKYPTDDGDEFADNLFNENKTAVKDEIKKNNSSSERKYSKILSNDSDTFGTSLSSFGRRESLTKQLRDDFRSNDNDSSMSRWQRRRSSTDQNRPRPKSMYSDYSYLTNESTGSYSSHSSKYTDTSSMSSYNRYRSSTDKDSSSYTKSYVGTDTSYSQKTSRPKSLYYYDSSLGKDSSYKQSSRYDSYKSDSRYDSNSITRSSVYQGHKPISKYSRSKEEKDYGRDEFDKRFSMFKTKEEKDGELRPTLPLSNDGPRSSYLLDKEKGNDIAYRGAWSMNVPKAPSHLKTCAAPEDSESLFTRRRRRESEFDQLTAERRSSKPSIEISDAEENDYSLKRWRDRRTSLTESKSLNVFDNSFNTSEDVNTSNLSLSPPSISAEDIDICEDKNDVDERMNDTEEVVFRPKKIQGSAAPARPSSLYLPDSSTDDGQNLSDLSGLSSYWSTISEGSSQSDSSPTKSYSNRDREDDATAPTDKKDSVVRRRIKNRQAQPRAKSVHLADVFAISSYENKNFSYLPQIKVHVKDPFEEEHDNFKRQFNQLIRKTEDWKLRAETLNDRARVLSNSYRSLSKAITGIRDESDNVYQVFGNVEQRLIENDVIGYPSSEDEWMRAFEQGKLLQKATQMIEARYDDPKPEFIYSDSEGETESLGSCLIMGSPWSSNESTAAPSLAPSGTRSRVKSRSMSSPLSGGLQEKDSLSEVGQSPGIGKDKGDSYYRRRRFQGKQCKSDAGYSESGLQSLTDNSIPETAV